MEIPIVSKVGVAIWGLGDHALNRIIPAFSSINEYSIIGVCSRTKSKVKKYSSVLNCEGWTEPTSMLADEKVKVVYICSPIGVHAKHVKKVLKAGKHAWCEKPLSCNIRDSKELIALAKKKHKMLAEAFMYLYHPQFSQVKNFVDSNNGRVKSIVCRFGIPSLEKPGFRDNPSLCGGAFWDVAAYPVSALLGLLPDQDVEILFAEIKNHNNSQVDTEGIALLRFSEGTIAFLEWGVGFAYKNEIDLWTEEESFFTNKIFSKPVDYQPVFRIQDKYGNETLQKGEKSEQFLDMFYNFYEKINSSSLSSEEYNHILKRAEVMDSIFNYVYYKNE
jgi:dTDP-3,4-didehydro-2,6-dideoxy-alpha-D-glucose 3-reductase